MRSLLIGCVVALCTVTAASSQPTSGAGAPPGWVSIASDQLQWRKSQDGTGRERADLFGVGEGSKPGTTFGWLARWPPHLITKAHSHPTPRYGMVLSGTFYDGRGNKFDGTKLERRSAGTFFIEPADSGHFGATKDEPATIYWVGIGPDRTNEIEK